MYIFSLHLKDEALDFLEQDTVRTLIKKYSQFINFPIHLWASKTVEVEEPVEDDEKPVSESEDEEAQVEDDTSDDKPKTKKIEKTVWDWEAINDSKPIWTRKYANNISFIYLCKCKCKCKLFQF